MSVELLSSSDIRLIMKQICDDLILVFQNAISYAMNEEWRRQYCPEYMDIKHSSEIEQVLEIPFDEWPYLPILGLHFLLMALIRRGHDVNEICSNYAPRINDTW